MPFYSALLLLALQTHHPQHRLHLTQEEIDIPIQDILDRPAMLPYSNI